jgi:hypothetical protein
MRMNNKFLNENLAGLEAMKLEVWGAFNRVFSSGWVPWWGCLEKKGSMLALAICLGTYSQQLFA